MFREVDEELSDDPDDKGEEGQKSDIDSEEEEDILHNVKLYQSDHNRHTLLKHKNPEAVVVENYSKDILNKKKKAKDGKSFAIAPGIFVFSLITGISVLHTNESKFSSQVTTHKYFKFEK